MKKNKFNIALFVKKDKPYINNIIKILKVKGSLDVYFTHKKQIPLKTINKKYDIIISYLSSWIIPKKILNQTKFININFHPGPPEYPGTGCFNFALYNNEKKYGVTCHIMEPKVDIGNIIKIRRFNISLKDNVDTLSSKSYIELYKLFQESIKYLFNHNFELPKSNFKWKRKPFKRTQLNELSTLKISMSKKEIFKRIRCTYLKDKPPPILKLYGKKFEYKE